MVRCTLQLHNDGIRWGGLLLPRFPKRMAWSTGLDHDPSLDLVPWGLLVSSLVVIAVASIIEGTVLYRPDI